MLKMEKPAPFSVALLSEKMLFWARTMVGQGMPALPALLMSMPEPYCAWFAWTSVPSSTMMLCRFFRPPPPIRALQSGRMPMSRPATRHTHARRTQALHTEERASHGRLHAAQQRCACAGLPAARACWW